VTSINIATNRPGEAITVGKGPRSIAITPNGTTAYVSNAGSGTVTPIRTATGTALKPVRVGKLPDAIAITPGSLYVDAGHRSRFCQGSGKWVQLA
jgi:YVTN family beta-propeller protein